MAFKPPKKSPQFADLKGILAQVKQSENPLYQVVELIIERLTQLKLVTPEEVLEAVNKNKPTGPQVALPHAPTHMPGGNDVLPVSEGSKLLGRGVTGPGPIENINLGTGLAMSGVTLNATGGTTPGPHGSTHAAGGSDALPIAAAQRLLGRGTGTPGPVQELTIGSGLSMTGGTIDIGAIPETAIIDGAILARVAANETITGLWLWSGIGPMIRITETDAVADAKKWRFYVSDGKFVIDTLNDAETVAGQFLSCERVATSVTTLKLFLNNALATFWETNGNFNHAKGFNLSIGSYVMAGSEGAFNPPGFGEVAVMAVYITTSVNIHAMVNKPHGHMVTIHNRHISAGSLGIIDMEPSVTAAYKIACPNHVSFNLPPGGSATFMWDANVGNWIVLGRAL